VQSDFGPGYLGQADVLLRHAGCSVGFHLFSAGAGSAFQAALSRFAGYPAGHKKEFKA
jgi:hypothetical protein